MKILIIGNGFIGRNDSKYYVNKHTSKFCNELIENNFKVGFLQFNKRLNKNADLLDSPLDNHIEVHTISSDKYKSTIGKLFSYIVISILTIKTILKYDFIYIFYPGHVPVLAAIVSILLRIKYGLYIRGQHNIETTIGKYVIKKANFCLTVSDLLKEQILINNKYVDVIAPMIDFSKKDILLNRNYSEDGKLRFLFVGRIELRKGIFDLLHAIKQLNNKYDNLHFDIVGGGESFGKIKNEFKEFSNIVMRGQISDKEELLHIYKHSDIFIFPSHDEGFPRVLYEAMMLRLPVITTMVGGIGGFMKDYHNCLAIESQNYHSIVEVVEKIIDDEELRTKLLEQATEDMLKLFDGSREKHSLLLINKLEEKDE